MGMRPTGQVPVTVPPMVPAPSNRMGNGYQNGGYMPMTSAAQNVNTVQAITPQSNMIWIDDPAEIVNWPSGRGWQQWFGDKTSMKVYVRDTDANGVIQPLRTFWLHTEPPVVEGKSADGNLQMPTNGNAQEYSAPQSRPVQQYPSKDDFDALVRISNDTISNVNKLTEAVSSLSGKMDEFLK